MYTPFVKAGGSGKIYAEREEPRLGKVDRFGANVGGMFAPWLRPRPGRFMEPQAGQQPGFWESRENPRPRLRVA